MTMNLGIIDVENNPFTTKSWIEQKRGISHQRLDELSNLFGKSIEEIKMVGGNKGKFPAFAGIRWGFAEMKGNRLTATTKWGNREQYDKFGL